MDDAQWDARSEVILSRLRKGVTGGWLSERWLRVVLVTAEVYTGKVRCEYLGRALAYAEDGYRDLMAEKKRAAEKGAATRAARTRASWLPAIVSG